MSAKKKGKYTSLPSFSGKQLIRLLLKAGGTIEGKSTPGSHVAVVYYVGGRKRVFVIPDTSSSLPTGTLHGIISKKQTGLGKNGLLKLLSKYGK
jgi:predicted RNA binding protein YcfA (HicA-like mRNA interferase family)